MLCKEELANEVCKGCMVWEWESKETPNEAVRTGFWNDTKSDNLNKFSVNTLFYVCNWILFTFPFFLQNYMPTDIGCMCDREGYLFLLIYGFALLQHWEIQCWQSVKCSKLPTASLCSNHEQVPYHRNVAFGILVFLQLSPFSMSLFKVAEWEETVQNHTNIVTTPQSAWMIWDILNGLNWASSLNFKLITQNKDQIHYTWQFYFYFWNLRKEYPKFFLLV